MQLQKYTTLNLSIQFQGIYLLEGLQDKYGLTYIFISHDLSVVQYISDRVAVMHLGMVSEIDPQKSYTRMCLITIR